MDQISSNKIQRHMGVKNMHMENIEVKELAWYGHMIECQTIGYQIITYRCESRRSIKRKMKEMASSVSITM